jgi:hypothetical protein
MRRVLLVLLVITGCGSATSAASPTPFASFIADTAAARYADYAGKPGTKVVSEQAFDEMRAYILARYRGKSATASRTEGTATFDTIDSVSVRRVTLPDMVRFPTLQAYLAKSPSGGKAPPL